MYKKDRYDFLQNGSRSEIEKYFNLLYKLSTKNIKYKNMLHMDMNFVKQYGGFSPRNPGVNRKKKKIIIPQGQPSTNKNALNYIKIKKFFDNKIIDIKNYLSIIINNIEFILLVYSPKGNDDKGCLWVKSIKNGENYYFSLYRSDSEGGFWRLGYKEKEDDRINMYKGDTDYVQQTFIHLKLQIFINENLTKINKNSISITPALSKSPFLNTNTNEEKNMINDKNRLLYLCNGDGSEYKNNKCGDKITKQNVNEMSKIIESNYNLGNFEFVNNYKFKKNSDSLNIDLNAKIYKIELLLKKNLNNNDLYLYFMKYNLSYKKLTSINIEKDDYFIPLLIISKDSSINEYGLYTKYVHAGNYICKLFEYNIQCHENEKYIDKCSKTYSYMGELYNKIFPDKKLVNQINYNRKTSEEKNDNKKKLNKTLYENL